MGTIPTQLCLGRLIIERLTMKKRYGRAIAFIENARRSVLGSCYLTCTAPGFSKSAVMRDELKQHVNLRLKMNLPYLKFHAVQFLCKRDNQINRQFFRAFDHQ